MKSNGLIFALFLTLSLASSPKTLAEDATPATTTTTSAADAEDKPVSAEEQAKWADQVKTKYKLTDAQMKTMTDAGLQGPALARTAALAEASKQPIDKIVQMRATEKMGWGKIAKTLGVPPSTLGQSVAGLHRNEHSADREQRKTDRKADREERKAARKAEREQRKAEKQQSKGRNH